MQFTHNRKISTSSIEFMLVIILLLLSAVNNEKKKIQLHRFICVY